MLSHALWRSRFGADPNVMGRTILVDEAPYTVIGVLPATFRSIDELRTGGPAAWLGNRLGILVPLVDNPETITWRTGTGIFLGSEVFVRLPDVRSFGIARAEVETLGRRMALVSRDLSYTLRPVTTVFDQSLPARMALLAAAAAVLVLLACATAALLMLERRESRRREFAIRTALGATRWQLAGEAAVEAAILGLAAAAVAVWCAWQGVAVARTVGGARVAGLASAELGWQAGTLALALSLGTALLASLFSSLTLRRSQATPWLPLRGIAPEPSRGFSGGRLVVAQIGLSVGLVIVAGLLARDFARQAAIDIGFRPKGLLTARVALNTYRHADRGRQFSERLLQRLRDVSGVEDVALASPPLGRPSAQPGGVVEGSRPTIFGYRIVSPSYFSLLGIPVLAGRTFSEAEVQSAEPVAVVNSTLAERYWGSPTSALGQRIWIGGAWDGTGRHRWLTIIGVTRDALDGAWTIPPGFYMTYSYAAGYFAPGASEVAFVLRAAEGQSSGMAARLKRAGEEVDPHVPLYAVIPLEQIVAAHLFSTRLLLAVVGFFSMLATSLAALGVYVVLAFAVTHRAREFGVRMALGASRREVLLLVLGQTLRLVGKGVLLTVPVTFGVLWFTAAEFLGVAQTDLWTCLWAICIIIGAAVIASLAPVWRAVSVDPSIVLRLE